MPIHPDVAARFPLLDGLTSLREAYGTPAGLAQIQRYETWEPEVGPPVVGTRDDIAPGPHGPVPVRIYTPDSPSGAGLVWAHGGGFVGGDLDMREADWTAREIAARAGAVVVSVDYRLPPRGWSSPPTPGSPSAVSAPRCRTTTWSPPSPGPATTPRPSASTRPASPSAGP